MRELNKLFENNRDWVKERLDQDPEYFERQTTEQKPQYLWIGCSDSRILANQIIGLDAGELFVHRNIANLFLHTDFNSLSVLQYAVDFLKVRHVIICGHYGCGGVKVAMENEQHGLVDNWLRNIRDICAREKAELDAIPDSTKRYERLVELNVIYQTLNVCHTTVVQNAWARKQPISVHGWVYDMRSGLLNDLDCCVSGIAQIEETYRTKKLH
ncbi:MAG: cynt7 [Chlamydiia bacterium]|nr:cynt7 [Chlamydiia bacterium]